MKRFIVILMIEIAAFVAFGQEYRVVSFEPVLKDLTARTASTSRVDGNGRKCAVIKVYVDDQIAAVRGNVVGEVSTTGMEKWVYLSHDSKDMELVFEHHYPLHITFIDYDIPTVTGQMSYVLKLKEIKDSESNIASNNIEKEEPVSTPASQPVTPSTQQSVTSTIKQTSPSSGILRVRDFKHLPYDDTASNNSTEKIDQNNRPAALIKIITELSFDQIFFDIHNGVIARENKSGEIWLYIPARSQLILITHPQYGSIKYYFETFIEGGKTYTMHLVVE